MLMTAVLWGLFVLGEVVPGSSSHPCDIAAPGTKVCDPDTGGRQYFLCRGNGIMYRFICPNQLVFDNSKQTCDWDLNVPCTTVGVAPKPTHTIQTTTTTTTTTPVDPAGAAGAPRSNVRVLGGKTATTLERSQSLVLLSGSHPCDKAEPNTKVCDPATGGRHYYLCRAAGIKYKFVCPDSLVFDNRKQTCDWDYKTRCTAENGPKPATTSLSTTTTKKTAARVARVVASAFAGLSLSNDYYAGDEAAYPVPEYYQNLEDFYGTAAAWEYYFNTPAYDDSFDTSDYDDGFTTPAYDDFFSTWAEAEEASAPYPEGTCNSWSCQLPHCRCVGTDIPGDLDPSEVPQMVLLTFDDAVKSDNFHYFEGLFPEAWEEAGRNPNGCRAAATFFVSGSGTDMSLVRTLVERGNEAASHSHTHTSPADWSREDWDKEIEGMRWRLAQGVGVPVEEVRGMRAPFLQLGGEDQFSMLVSNGFLYDSSMFGGSAEEDDSSEPLWPFTLDYPPSPSQTVCDQERCPSRSYPQLWEVPLLGQYNPGGQSCTMTDGCFTDSDASKDEIVEYLRHNFERHYERNRAPFMISLHATWFDNVPESYPALGEFLREISRNPDVWQVTMTQMLDWVRHPLPMSRVTEIASWQCFRK